MKQTSLTPSQSVHAKLLFKRGTSVGTIASKLRVPEPLVRLTVKVLKEQTTPTDISLGNLKEKVNNLKAIGYSHLQISRMLKLPANVIAAWIYKPETKGTNA